MWERLLDGLVITGVLIIGIACVPVVIGCLVLVLGICALMGLFICALFLLLIIVASLKDGYSRLRRKYGRRRETQEVSLH